MRILVASLLFFFCFSSASFGEEDKFKTNGSYNGRYWMAMNQGQKLAYLQGFYAGLEVMALAELGKRDELQIGKNYAVPNMTAGEVMEAVDKVFTDFPELRRASIVAGLALVSLRAKGLSEEFQKRKDSILNATNPIK